MKPLIREAQRSTINFLIAVFACLIAILANGCNGKIDVGANGPSDNTDANVNLSSLVLSDGTLMPTFNSSTLSYTAAVTNDVSFITVTPISADAGAALTVQGTIVASGVVSEPISLFVGPNTISIDVTAPNGNTKKSYFVVVTRGAASPAKEITSFSFTKAANSSLASDVIGQIVDVDIIAVINAVDVTALVATFETTGETVTVNGVKQESGVTINNFTNPVIYTVTAKDGSTKNFTVIDTSTNKNNYVTEWPNATNTGPTGTLTRYDGDILTTYDGQIIENMEIHGLITIIHDNVTIRNCEIYGNSENWIVVNAFVVGYHNYDLLIEDCKIDGNGITTGTISGRNYTLRRCEIIHAAQLVKFNSGKAVIENNYLHDVWGHYPNSHNVGIGTNGEPDTTDTMDITIRNNNINAATTDGMGGSSAAISLWGDFGRISNVLVEHNRVEVGVDESYYVIAAGNPIKPFPHSANIVILNNDLVYTNRVGRDGGIMFFENANGNYASGNIWEDTGAIVVPNPGGY